MTTKFFVLCFSRYLCRIKNQLCYRNGRLNEKTGSKSGIKWKMQLTKAIHLVNFKKCETVIHIFKQRKGQTYENLS